MRQKFERTFSEVPFTSIFSVYEIFQTTEVLLGNDPISTNVMEMLEGLEDLDLIDILTMLQFKFTVEEVFVNWDPVKSYLENELNINNGTLDSIAEATLNIPGVCKTQLFKIKRTILIGFFRF